MIYSHPLYRPPSEANSLIFQVTEGCSFNQCSFCSMYRQKDFSEKPVPLIVEEIKMASESMPYTQRVFLADGDALYRSNEDLLIILAALYQHFPQLQRISCYALPQNLHKKSLAKLEAIKQAGLQLIYYGIESGSTELLKCITKGSTPDKMIAGINKASQAGLKISATVILGLGGQQYWQEHIQQTADLVNQLRLDYLSTLQLTLRPDIKDEFFDKFERQNRTFTEQGDQGILQEQIMLISLLAPDKTLIFRSNHASNALPLKGNLPDDKEYLLAQLQGAYQGDVPLVPKWTRGL